MLVGLLLFGLCWFVLIMLMFMIGAVFVCCFVFVCVVLLFVVVLCCCVVAVCCVVVWFVCDFELLLFCCLAPLMCVLLCCVSSRCVALRCGAVRICVALCFRVVSVRCGACVLLLRVLYVFGLLCYVMCVMFLAWRGCRVCFVLLWRASLGVLCCCVYVGVLM